MEIAFCRLRPPVSRKRSRYFYHPNFKIIIKIKILRNIDLVHIGNQLVHETTVSCGFPARAVLPKTHRKPRLLVHETDRRMGDASCRSATAPEAALREKPCLISILPEDDPKWVEMTSLFAVFDNGRLSKTINLLYLAKTAGSVTGVQRRPPLTRTNGRAAAAATCRALCARLRPCSMLSSRHSQDDL